MDGGAAGVHANPGKRRRGSRVRLLSQVHRRPRRAAQPRRGRVFGGGSRRERRDARERKRVRNVRGLVDGGARARGDVRGASRGGGHRAGGAVSPPRHARVLGVVLFDDVSRAPTRKTATTRGAPREIHPRNRRRRRPRGRTRRRWRRPPPTRFDDTAAATTISRSSPRRREASPRKLRGARIGRQRRRRFEHSVPRRGGRCPRRAAREA